MHQFGSYPFEAFHMLAQPCRNRRRILLKCVCEWSSGLHSHFLFPAAPPQKVSTTPVFESYIGISFDGFSLSQQRVCQNQCEISHGLRESWIDKNDKKFPIKFYSCLQLGIRKSLFVNENTTAVHRSMQVIDWMWPIMLAPGSPKGVFLPECIWL